jgi:hypothetical protein
LPQIGWQESILLDFGYAKSRAMPPEDSPSPSRFRFTPRHDHLLQATFVIAVFFLAIGSILSYWYWQRSAWQRIDVAPDQPVMCSHKHHVGELGIDCRYCHAGVETSSYPGMPPTETCMTCHSQLWTNAKLLQPVRDSARSNRPLAWNKVTNIPNYVYFDHSAHISRGVACVTCHGRVDEMPLTFQSVELKMAWCLDCHRHPEERIVPRSQVTMDFPDPHALSPAEGDPLPLTAAEKARLTNCSVCHR